MFSGSSDHGGGLKQLSEIHWLVDFVQQGPSFTRECPRRPYERMYATRTKLRFIVSHSTASHHRGQSIWGPPIRVVNEDALTWSTGDVDSTIAILAVSVTDEKSRYDQIFIEILSF